MLLVAHAAGQMPVGEPFHDAPTARLQCNVLGVKPCQHNAQVAIVAAGDAPLAHSVGNAIGIVAIKAAGALAETVGRVEEYASFAAVAHR